MQLSLKHNTYNSITCLRSLKNSYSKLEYKEQLFSKNKMYKIELLTLISIILKSQRILCRKFNITNLLEYHTVNQKKSVLSKYIQSYTYMSSKQNNFTINLYKNKEIPLNLMELNSLYINYKLLRSKNPVYIYHKIENKL